MGWSDHPDCDRVRRAYRESFGRDPEVLVRAPGRVVFLGSHIDHQGGSVLTAAIDRAVYLAAGSRFDGQLRLSALDFEESSCRAPAPRRHGQPIRWADYPEGVFLILSGAGYRLGGLDAVYGGHLPRESGVSSSAAVEVAFLLAFRALGGLDIDRATLARLGQRVENEALGIASGVMDQTAILFGRRDHLLLIDCRTLERREIGWPDELTVVLLDTGTRRALGSSPYGDPRKDCERALSKLRQRGMALERVLDLDPSSVETARSWLTAGELRRVRHVVEENARVQKGAADLLAGALESFGRQMTASHASSRDLWGSSTEELNLLVDEASRAGGCLGAKLCGAGLGGHAIAVVHRDAADGLRARVRASFERRFGRVPAIEKCEIADGAEVQRCG